MTPTPEKLDAALKGLTRLRTKYMTSHMKGRILNEHSHVFDFALRFTRAAMGNFSQETIQAGIDSYNESGKFAITTHTKAMIAQIVKEVGDV